MINCRKCNINKHFSEYNVSRLNKNDYICRICEKEYNYNYIKLNRNKICEKRKIYRKDNIIKIKKQQLKYTLNNKDNKKLYDQKYNKIRNRKPEDKLKRSISRSINLILSTNKSNKNKFKILNYVPWTLEELKNHIEYHFSLLGNEWMSWNNYGTYRTKEWNDNDKTTWKWHLDHIIPHSHFNYTSMEGEEFKKCWSLENLRPYSAKQNIIDGNRR